MIVKDLNANLRREWTEGRCRVTRKSSIGHDSVVVSSSDSHSESGGTGFDPRKCCTWSTCCYPFGFSTFTSFGWGWWISASDPTHSWDDNMRVIDGCNFKSNYLNFNNIKISEFWCCHSFIQSAVVELGYLAAEGVSSTPRCNGSVITPSVSKHKSVFYLFQVVWRWF